MVKETAKKRFAFLGYTLSGIDTTSMPVFLYTKRTAAALMLYNQFTTKIM